MCGAATGTAKPQCLYCGARLATIACPSCFGMMFIGSKHCPRCGAQGAREVSVTLAPKQCPRCQIEMTTVKLGATDVRECERCSGLWAEVSALEQICADRERQAAVLGAAQPAQGVGSDGSQNVRYVPCPECGQLMNRLNFARCSGVIVDVCKRHGTWFDENELQRIVEFIRGGGMDASRAREKEQLAEERQRLRQEQFALTANADNLFFNVKHDNERRSGAAHAASELLKALLD